MPRYALITINEQGQELAVEERDLPGLPMGGKVWRQQGTKLALQQVGWKQEQQGLRWEMQGFRTLLDPVTLIPLEIPNMVQVPNMADVPDMQEVQVPNMVEVDETARLMVKHVGGKPVLRPIETEEIGGPFRQRVHVRTRDVIIEATRVVHRYVVTLRALATVRAALVLEVRRQARDMLFPTDWYGVRLAELGTAVPVEVASWRQAVRAAVTAIEAEIAAKDLAQLAVYDWGAEWPPAGP